jgi:hypothetical protein
VNARDFDRQFDREFDETRRRIMRTRRAIILAMVILWALIIGASGWVLLHPENVGAFFGRVASGFNGIGGTDAR